MSQLLDQFGKTIRPPYYDENAAAFALSVYLPEEIRDSIEKSQEFYRAMRGVDLFDADGQRVNTSEPQTVSTSRFRHPITYRK